ncbi:MAG: N-acetylneuraminate synthase family protein [Nitrosopumilus sp.]|nr:N-acetylneuraminate synthase family protein [Nitrosopumilus sp.]
MAKVLIESASNAGANAIKFQTYKSESVYVKNAGSPSYLSKAGIKESIGDIFDDLSMPHKIIPELADICKSFNIEFMSTPFSVNDAKALDPYVKRHKIASYEISHSRLIEFVAKTKKPLLLSTGAATMDEIEWALNHFKENGGSDITLLQTTAKYPAPFSSLNLKVIRTLKEKFNVKVGFSDHSRDPIIAPISAVSLGVSVIEKHFTLHNKLPGPDHFFAVTPNELEQMVKAIRNCELSLGSGKKIIQKEEKELRKYAQRAIQAIKPIKKGEIFRENRNIGILRSGNQKKGIHPKYISNVEGKKARRKIEYGQGITAEDYE